MDFKVSYPYPDTRIAFVEPTRRFHTGPLEHAEQIAVVRRLRRARVHHFAIPNGHKREKDVAQAIKAEGGTEGPPDLMLGEQVGNLARAGKFMGLEMKRICGSPSDASPEQLFWLGQVANWGGDVVVAAGAEAALWWINKKDFTV